MIEPHILVRNLSKTYRVPEREAGLRASVRNLWRRKYRDVEAVCDISFSIEKGEMIGFIGPNGAGKTTTLKILAGLLYPSKGKVSVAGFIPWERKANYLRRISMVLGNKSQVSWDIPAMDTFHVLGEIYRVPKAELQRTLDEPTLGLDISMQNRLRRFMVEYNRRSHATVILTSHYMADVAALCQRVIVINRGQLLYDGALSELAKRLAPFKLIRMVLSDEHVSINPILPQGVDIIERENANWTLRVGRDHVPSITTQLLNVLPVVDLAIEDPPLEAVIDQIYQEGRI